MSLSNASIKTTESNKHTDFTERDGEKGYNEEAFLGEFGEIPHMSVILPWPDDIPGFRRGVEDDESLEDECNYFCFEEWFEGIEYTPFFWCENEEYEGEEGHVEEEREDSGLLSAQEKQSAGRPEEGEEPIFVHGSPSIFPDLRRARESIFRSIFLKSSTRIEKEASMLKSIADTNYSMVHSLLKAFDEVLSKASTDAEKRQITLTYKESIVKLLERHGISKTYSDGSIHWNVYPITKNDLFSIQLGDNLHQTRQLFKFESRVVEGPVKKFRPTYDWPTLSVWTGQWNLLGMAGSGTYIMPHGVVYHGSMRDGRFHDDNATLTYPNNFKAIHCVYENGVLLDCQFQFPDGLKMEKENWKYCMFPDRRFQSEVINGLKPGKIAQKTELDPARRIPHNCYDTNDGFYNPKSLCLVSPQGEVLRVPVCEEDVWIKKYCRKGFQQPTGFRPDLFENWFDPELTTAILKKQKEYRQNKITYAELQHFYADKNLLPPWSKYIRAKTSSEITLHEMIPNPKPLRMHKVRKYKGHNLDIPTMELVRRQTGKSEDETRQSEHKRVSRHFSTPEFTDAKEPKKDIEKVKISKEAPIPKDFLKYQPLIRPPFMPKPGLDTVRYNPLKLWKRCKKLSSTDSLDKDESSASTIFDQKAREAMQKKRVEKLMRRIILDAAEKGLQDELERDRRNLMWAQTVGPKINLGKSESKRSLAELYHSEESANEFCDFDFNKTCRLAALSKDVHDTLKYWGEKTYMLCFEKEEDEDA